MGTTATGWLGIGLSTPTTALQVQGDTVQAGQVTALSYHDANGNAALILRRGRGTMAAPGMVTLGDYTGALTFQGWARNGADTADIFVQTALMRSEVDSVDAQGRIGGRLAFFTNPAASGGVVERLRIDGQGNLTTTGANITTGLQAGLALKIGARPSATLPDAVETWVEDFESGATAASLLVWPEGAIAPTTIGNGLLHKMVGRSLTTHSVSSPYVLTAEMSGKLLISNNATELGVIQLPLCPNPSSWGLYYVIGNYQASPRGTRIVPGTGGRIQLASTAGAANQAIQSQVSGDYMTIVCINNGFWHIMSPAQGWVFV
jgi:hypothetical protein